MRNHPLILFFLHFNSEYFISGDICKVLAANLPTCPRGVKVSSREHKLYASLRGTGPSSALAQLTANNLPVFSQPLKHAVDSRLSESDVATGGFNQAPLDHHSSDVTPAAAASVAGVKLRNHWTARGNISAFLAWCKDLGISQTVLFETTGLGEYDSLFLHAFLFTLPSYPIKKPYSFVDAWFTNNHHCINAHPGPN